MASLHNALSLAESLYDIPTSTLERSCQIEATIGPPSQQPCSNVTQLVLDEMNYPLETPCFDFFIYAYQTTLLARQDKGNVAGLDVIVSL